jgi:tRNA dimethylallyltransferase
MFKNGAIDEVKRFVDMKVYYELSANKIIGVREIRDYIDGKMTLIKAKERIKLKTRQYAKRQFTWFRGQMLSWKKIYSPNFELLFKEAINKIS